MSQSVKIGNLVLGEGIPKICVPIVGRTEEEVLDLAANIMDHKPDMVEWRIDFLTDVFNTEKTIGALKKLKDILKEIPLLVTFRTKGEGGEQSASMEEYIELYEKIMGTQFADAIDVEAFFGEKILETLSEKAHSYGVKVVASNHDFLGTPPGEELERRLRFMQSSGADVAKIAVMPQSQSDVLTLLSATEVIAAEGRTPVITMSMGGKGMVSRILGENFGSCLTFGMVGRASAPGQIPIGQLRTLLDTIHQYS
ncbi:MAG: type I 3-dehydroquinate dehydratase [Eubacteriales bacterium]|nr:type I 3-dehydroquinate dehydratase [Eubacteriales bacterium]